MNKIVMIAITTGAGLSLAGPGVPASAQGSMNMQQQQQQQMQPQPMQRPISQAQMAPQQMMPQQPTVRVNAMSKSTWFQAPREIQITDERPVVRDFREADQMLGSLAVPPVPVGNPGVLPATGLPLGNGGFRTLQPSSPVALPRSGFGSTSNIPATLLRPVAGLQKGQSTGSIGNAGVPKPLTRPAAPMLNAVNRKPPTTVAPQQTMTYSQPGGQTYGNTNGGVSTVVKSGVSGKLMNRIK